MKAPTSLFDRPGRAAAVVGAVLTVSATAAVALISGTAAAAPDADEPGRCTKNVNVRAQPDVTSQIVALCEEGTAVLVGESRAGFLRLTDLGGWAAQEYISVNGRAPAPAERASTSESDDGADESGAGQSSSADGSSKDEDSAENDGADDDEDADGRGGLLG